jgi:hypothetical protein
MTLTRVHATDTRLAVATRLYTTPKHNRQTTTSLPYGEKLCVCEMPHNPSQAKMFLASRR